MKQSSSKRELIDPSDLLLFGTIADAGSLTSAAKQLGTTQSALSKRLQRLEAFLGVAVFERSLRGVALTEYGQALLHRARAIRAQAEQGLEEVLQIRGKLDGKVNVALSHFASVALFSSALREFRAHWPGISIHVSPPPFDLSGLREGNPDFAIISSGEYPLGKEFIARPLYSTSLAIVMRPGHPLEGAQQLSDLAGAEWILPKRQSSTASALYSQFRKARLPDPLCLITCETLTGIEMVLFNSDLLGVMPMEIYRMRPQPNRLIRSRIAPFAGPNIVSVKWSDTKLTPAAQALEELFIAVSHQLALGSRTNEGKLGSS